MTALVREKSKAGLMESWSKSCQRSMHTIFALAEILERECLIACETWFDEIVIARNMDNH
jgi:hypothetical protein